MGGAVGALAQGSVKVELIPGGELANAFAALDQATARREALPDNTPEAEYESYIDAEIDALVAVTAAPCRSVSEVGYKLHRLTTDQAFRDQIQHVGDLWPFLASLAVPFGIKGEFLTRAKIDSLGGD